MGSGQLFGGAQSSVVATRMAIAPSYRWRPMVDVLRGTARMAMCSGNDLVFLRSMRATLHLAPRRGRSPRQSHHGPGPAPGARGDDAELGGAGGCGDGRTQATSWEGVGIKGRVAERAGKHERQDVGNRGD
jgi:hypothetical protein